MRNTAKLYDITWVMLSDAGINVDNAHRFPGLHSILVYSEDGTLRATFGPATGQANSSDDTEGDLGWEVNVHERIDDTWVMNEWLSIPTAREAVAHVAKSLGYAT